MPTQYSDSEWSSCHKRFLWAASELSKERPVIVGLGEFTAKSRLLTGQLIVGRTSAGLPASYVFTHTPCSQGSNKSGR